MKKMKWLRKLPILLLALIIAVSPLMMAVPASAVDSTVVPDIPVYDGYAFCYWDYESDVVPVAIMVSIDNPLLLAPYDDACCYIFSKDLVAVIESLSISVVDNTLQISVWSSFFTRVFACELTVVDCGSYVLNLLTPYGDNLWSDDMLSIPLDGAYLMANSIVEFDGSYPHFYRWIIPSTPPNLYSVFSVFSGVGSWLSGAIQSASTMFWTAESGMTVIGYLAVASLGLAVILLIFSLIAGWLKFH